MKPLLFEEYDGRSLLFKNKRFCYLYVTLTENNVVIDYLESFRHRRDKNELDILELEKRGALIPKVNGKSFGQVYFRRKDFDLSLFGNFLFNETIFELTNLNIENIFAKAEIYETFA